MTKEVAQDLIDRLPILTGMRICDLAEAYYEGGFGEVDKILASASNSADYTGQIVGLAEGMYRNLSLPQIQAIRKTVIGRI